MLVQEERSYGTVFALQVPEEVRTTGKRNQILDWKGPTTARKKGGRSNMASVGNGQEGG